MNITCYKLISKYKTLCTYVLIYVYVINYTFALLNFIYRLHNEIETHQMQISVYLRIQACPATYLACAVLATNFYSDRKVATLLNPSAKNHPIRGTVTIHLYCV